MHQAASLAVRLRTFLARKWSTGAWIASQSGSPAGTVKGPREEKPPTSTIPKNGGHALSLGYLLKKLCCGPTPTVEALTNREYIT
jgi:hypothetical protein